MSKVSDTIEIAVDPKDTLELDTTEMLFSEDKPSKPAGLGVEGETDTQALDTLELPHGRPERRAQAMPVGGLAEKRIEIANALIQPLRSANVPSEVSGVIWAFNFEEGDKVNKGDVVVEVSKRRHSVIVRSAKRKLTELEIALRLSEEKQKLAEDLLTDEPIARQRILEAKSEVAQAKGRIETAKAEFSNAFSYLEACSVKAPFTGYIAARLKETHEAVDELESLFLLVDTSGLIVQAEAPENVLPACVVGAAVEFAHSSGKRYTGTVKKAAPLVNPKSGAGTIWATIENPDGELKPGMIGVLALNPDSPGKGAS